jgi:hypothetical protein
VAWLGVASLNPRVISARPPEPNCELISPGQNVACDSCKLRRIKCDLLNLLIPSESTSSQPPLHVLVQQNPDVDCTNCKNKGLKCTTDGIVNPTRPNKGGKRIDEARQKFGGGGAAEQPEHLSSGGAKGAEGSASAAGAAERAGVNDIDVDVDIDFVGTLPQLDQIPFETFITDTQIFPSDFTQANFTDLTHLTSAPATSDPLASASASLGPWLQAQTQTQAQPAGLAPPDLTTPWGSNSSFGDQASSFGQSRSATHSNSPENVSAAGAPPPAPAEDAAAHIWRHFTEHPQQAAPNPIPASSSTDKSPNLQAWTKNVGQSFASWNPNPSSFASAATPAPSAAPANTSAPSPKDFGTYLNDDGVPSPDISLWSVQQTKPTHGRFASISSSRFGAHRAPVQSRPFTSGSGIDTYSVAGRKRSRLDSDAASEYSDSSGSADNPWRLFAEPSAVMHWGRREVVQESLADRALGLELSKHLVKVFFQAVHLSFPVRRHVSPFHASRLTWLQTVSPESFYIEWERAGQRSDRMTPQQEVLCATIEAWGARFSDSPVVRLTLSLVITAMVDTRQVLGLPSNKAGNAPRGT